MTAIRRLATADLARIQPLFHQVFGLPISIALLRWKYAEGRGESWVMPAADGEHLALHCGVIFRDVLLAGQPVRAAQLADLMSRAKDSGLSRGQSPFRLVMQALLESLPRPDNPAGVAFGFPSERAMRLGEHLGVYRAIDHWLELRFHACRAGRLAPKAVELLSCGPEQAVLVDALWQRMAKDLRDYCVGVRDAAFFQRRYLRHPERRYVVLQINSGWLKRPLGLAVVRLEDEACELMDIVGAWADMPDMILALQAWLMGLPDKTLVFALTAHFAEKLRPLAVHCEQTQFRIMANPQTPEAVLAQLENRWWLTGGDTDYR